MNRYISDADDFYVNVHLNTEMELPNNRDTVLHFFEQMKKGFPGAAELLHAGERRPRPRGGQGAGIVSLAGDRAAPAVLGADQSRDARRCVSPARAGPGSGSAAVDDQLARLRGARRHVRLRLQFRRQPRRGGGRGARGWAWPGRTLRAAARPGDQLRAVDDAGAERVVSTSVPAGDRDPDQCDQVRTREYGDDQISVYFTVRQYWGSGPELTFLESLRRQREIGEEILQQSVIPRIVRPLAQVIASR